MKWERTTCLALAVLCTAGLFAQTSIDDTSEAIADVGVDEKRGDMLDLQVSFTDRNGEKVQLSELIEGDLPIVLAPVYYNCPSLCTMVLNGVTDLIDELALVPGRDYRIINVSFDPRDSHEVAAKKAVNYNNASKKADQLADNWYWLTGSETSISQVMDQIGFRYKLVGEEYSHTSTIVILSPKGMVSQYFYGVQFPARDVRMALVDAAEGRVGTAFDQILMYCFRFDPKAGKYVPYAWGIMRLGGALTLVLLALVGVFLWKLEFTERRRL